MQKLKNLWSFPTVLRIESTAVITLLLVGTILWRGGKSIDATWVLVGITWFLTISYYLSRPKVNTVIPLWFWLTSLTFCIWTVLSFLTSTTANYGLDEVFRTLCLVFCMFWMARTIEQERDVDLPIKSLDVVLLWIAYATVIASAIGYAVYIFQPVDRFVGTFFDYRFHTDYWPNAWAQYLLLAWPIVVWWTQKWLLMRLNIKRICFLEETLQVLILSFVFASFLLSYSRGALIAFIGQLILCALYILYQKRAFHFVRLHGPKILLIIVGSSLIFLGTNRVRSSYYAVQSVKEKATFTAAEGTSSKTERAQFWAHAVDLTLEKPVTGWGPYSFRFVQPRLQRHVLATSDHPHNVFLKYSMERGVPAAVLFVLILLLVFKKPFFALYKTRTTDFVVIMSAVSVLGVTAHNLIDYNLQFVGIALPFWLLLGVLLSSSFTKRDVRIANSAATYTETIVITLVLLLAFVEGYFLVVSSIGRHAEANGDIEKALTYYQKAHHQIFSRDMHLSRVQLLASQRGRLEEANAMLDYYFYVNEEDPRAWKLSGDVCSRLRDWNCALGSYNRAYQLGKWNDISITYAYTQLLESVGQKAEIVARREEIEELTNAYHAAVLRNAHFIALSQNADVLFQFTHALATLFPEKEPQYIVMGAQVDRKMQEERERLKARPPGYLW